MAEVFHPFKLSPSFIDTYVDEQPEWGPLGYITYKRTYSRLLPDTMNGETEEFWHTCRRVVEGVYTFQKKHCFNLRLPWNNVKAQQSAQEMYKRMWEFKWLPPGRGLWVMGSPIVDKIGGAALNSCGFTSTKNVHVDFADPFCWLMDKLMLGVGVGFDTKGAGKVKVCQPKQGDDVYVVGDSREGWVALLRRVLLAYSGFGTLPASIDYSEVRPYGSPIKGFGGTASGPGPLKDLIVDVRKTLDTGVDKPLTSSAIVDVCNLVGRCVVAGNVRRSAEISFGDPNDKEFLALKDPDTAGEALMSHRWSSNNSIFAEVGMNYEEVAERTAKNGEPGYQWLKNAQDYSRMGVEPDYSDQGVEGANPCSEQSLFHKELCTLVETFPARHETSEDYLVTLKYAYLYAKSVTLIPTHDEATNMVMGRNRRIGASMSGIVQAVEKFGRRRFLSEFCDAGYTYLKSMDQQYSDWLCVPKSRKITSVKPSGSVSLLPQVTPGIHFPHSEHYIRRIRFQQDSSLVGLLKYSGYHVEKDQYSPNTVVASFPVKETHFSRSKFDVSMWEQLEMAAQMQQYWADNQVSITVTFNKDEEKDIKHALSLYETRLKGVSFLPISEHGYVQAPYEEISEEVYNEMLSKIQPITPETGKTIAHEKTDKFCSNDTCEIALEKLSA